MAIGALELSIFLTAQADRSHGNTSGWAVVVAAAAANVLFLAMLLVGIARRISGPGDQGPGDGGGGGGLRREGEPPKRPPPAGPVCWPEFERQFAEYVTAQRAPTAALSGDPPDAVP